MHWLMYNALCYCVHTGIGRQPVATPPHRSGSAGSHASRVGSLDEGRNLEIITEGAELQMRGERPRSATLPGNMMFSFGGEAEKEEGKESTDSKKEEEAGKEEEDDNDKVFSQGKIGDHKFYSFTK